MKIKFKRKTSTKVVARLKNRARIRKVVSGTPERPRLAVFRSSRFLYAQLVDDTSGTTICSATTMKKGVKSACNKDAAKDLGQQIAKLAIDKSIKSVVFDRSGYVYHGKIQFLADAAREAGLNF